VVWCWDDLNVHLTHELGDFGGRTRSGYACSSCRPTPPEVYPAKGVWSLLRRSLADFAAAPRPG
jgi:hypothetical protein